jgi:drug/metabolite transporter (DMT)-like permease
MGDLDRIQDPNSLPPEVGAPASPDGEAPSAPRRLVSARHLAFAAVYLIWGSTYLAIRIGVTRIPPFLLAGGRSLIAGGAMLAWLLARGARLPTRREWTHASVAGVSMLAGGNGLVTLAETHVPSNLAALMIAGVPAYVVLLDWWRPGGRHPSRQALSGVLLGSIGMLLLVRPDPGTLGADHWFGVGALFVAGLCWAFGSLYSRYQRQHPSPAVAGAQQMLAGGGAMVLVSLARGEVAGLSLERLSGASVAAFVYLTLFGSMLAFSAFNWLVLETTPAQLATTSYVNPLVALILGWLVLGERLSPLSLAGAALILCAVVVMLARFDSSKQLASVVAPAASVDVVPTKQ